MSDLFQFKQVSAGYDGTAVLHDIDLSVQKGETVAVIGANGAGKTTLLRAALGEVALHTGEAFFEGRSLGRRAIFERTRSGIGYAPEGRCLFPMMTVAENLELGAFRESARERRRRIDFLLEVFPKLVPLRQTNCGLLSGGEQQMVAIARALMGKPRLIFLDEPSTGLAPKIVTDMYRSLARLIDDGVTVVVAEQNARAALKLADIGIVLEEGRITVKDDASKLLNDPRVLSAYVGSDEKGLWASKVRKSLAREN